MEWELAASLLGYTQPLVALVAGCIAGSPCASSLCCGSRVLCAWGASELRPGVGLAWLIATKEAQLRAASLQRFFAAGIASLHAFWPMLEAHAFEGNHLHHWWMERLGFSRGPTSELVPGDKFLVFSRDIRVHRPD